MKALSKSEVEQRRLDDIEIIIAYLIRLLSGKGETEMRRLA